MKTVKDVVIQTSKAHADSIVERVISQGERISVSVNRASKGATISSSAVSYNRNLNDDALVALFQSEVK